jgi:uncharacterized membrane protein
MEVTGIRIDGCADMGYQPSMTSSRLEAFSDGVIAVIITIMVLDLKPPHEAMTESVLKLLPAFLSYLLSFVIISMYWVNHHHLIHTVKKVDSATLWSNLNLLFWLSLFPWVTGFLNETHASSLSVSLYGVAAFATGLSFNLLRQIIARHHREDVDFLHQHRRRNKFSLIALSFYFSSILVAWVSAPIAILLIATPLLIYFFPNLIFPERKA